MSAARPVPARVALITGGSRGIGLAMARAFAREGYAVVISGREAKRLKAAARELEKTSKAEITALPCDVSDPAAVERLLAEVRRQHPAINVLVNNAGVAHALATVEKLPVEIWKQVIDTNLTGTFLVTRAALPLMRAGSIIVNNLSVAAVNVFEGMGAYNASKAGALGFTNVLRQELRQRGIRVLALLAGATNTEIWEQFWPEAPKEKMVSPETVAQAVLFAVNAPANAAVEEIKIGPAAGAL
jgi:NAD(P)-dependent dehydrogenase (short-subunit alcohol dehydrogenase family)